MTLPTPLEQKVSKPRGEKYPYTHPFKPDKNGKCWCNIPEESGYHSSPPNQEPDKYKLFNSITIGKKTHYFKPTYGKSIRLENGSVVIEAGESSVSYKIEQEPVERWQDEFQDLVVNFTIINDKGTETSNEILDFIAHQKALSRAEVLEEVRGKVRKVGGDFRSKYAGFDFGYKEALSDTLAVVDELQKPKEWREWYDR
jgi:hypothetical protein